MSQFDRVYRSLLFTKFFSKGWGKPEDIKRVFEFRKIISNRETCKGLVERDYPVHIDKDVTYKDCRILEGHFMSPFFKYLPGIAPKPVETAHFQMVLPVHWKKSTGLKPVVVQLASTGDHYYGFRRNLMAKPLLNEAGIASIILQNPFYGLRKPKEQLRSSLLNVNDLFVMGGALILESLVLFHWCEREGWGPLGIHGISLGGHMASLAATNWHKPISLIPCLSWSTASQAFTEGALRGAVKWNVLQSQYYEDSVYQQDIQKHLHSPEKVFKGAYPLGKQFVKDYPENAEDIDSLYEYYRQRGHEIFLNRSKVDENPKRVAMETSSSSSIATQPKVPEVEKQSENEPVKSVPQTLQYAVSKSKSPFKSIPQTLQYAASKSKLSLPKVTAEAAKKFKTKEFSEESIEFMRGVMDECTHLGNYSVPVDPRLIIIVAAEKDAYIPRDGLISLDKLWPGSEIRYIKSGHIAAFVLNTHHFRKAIKDSFDRHIKLYYS